jgi:hypothetical protein
MGPGNRSFRRRPYRINSLSAAAVSAPGHHSPLIRCFAPESALMCFDGSALDASFRSSLAARFPESLLKFLIRVCLFVPHPDL